MLRKTYPIMSIELLRSDTENELEDHEFEVEQETADKVEDFFNLTNPAEFFVFKDKDKSMYVYRTSLIKTVTIL